MNTTIIATKRLKKRRNFLLSLILWSMVSALLFFLNLLMYKGEWWVLFPITIWGLVLFFQTLELFGWTRAVEQWENKKIHRSFNS